MNDWNRQDTKEHICIWSNKWMENYHRERLKRVGIRNDEAKVRSANIHEIAEDDRNDHPSQ